MQRWGQPTSSARRLHIQNMKTRTLLAPRLDRVRKSAGLVLSLFCFASLAQAQVHDPPDQGEPGDEMIQNYLRHETGKIEADVLGSARTAETWGRIRPRYVQEYFDMLGLWPLPGRSPLHATVTRTLNRGDYLVEMVHYQSRPGLYVTGNLYRPTNMVSSEKLPAILYVCGHSSRGRNGNKTAFQSHGIWFARHGYVCLIVDTLQLGEIPGIHHGTYREGRWWWLSRGYTPAGVECWNGIRGIDYLQSRPDVDPDRIGVTGISGGGAATFWITVGDERVKAAVPVSGMADLTSYVPNRVINGHCDCMFLYNAYQWPWTRIAALAMPRPLLFVNSDQDNIFPMDANERVINRLERIYSLFGAGDRVDSLVSIGGHAYRKDLRQAAYRFMNTYLKNDARPVLDSEVDLVTGPREEIHPISPEELRVFPKDSDIPKDAINSRVDTEFVPMARLEPSKDMRFETWKLQVIERLRTLTFHHFPEIIPPAERWQGKSLDAFAATADPFRRAQTGIVEVSTEPGIHIRLRELQRPAGRADRVLLYVTHSKVEDVPPPWMGDLIAKGDAVFICEPRGIGGSRWTRKDPPNYVERSHYLLGRTVDSGRVWDVAAVARHLRRAQPQAPLFVTGESGAGVLGAYAALLAPEISGVILSQVPESHMNEAAPVLLNVLRVCDIPDALGLLAPRPITILGTVPSGFMVRTEQLYRAAGASGKAVWKK